MLRSIRLVFLLCQYLILEEIEGWNSFEIFWGETWNYANVEIFVLFQFQVLNLFKFQPMVGNGNAKWKLVEKHTLLTDHRALTLHSVLRFWWWSSLVHCIYTLTGGGDYFPLRPPQATTSNWGRRGSTHISPNLLPALCGAVLYVT